MADFTQSNLLHIKSHRLPGLSLSPHFIHPDYGGGSILNLPSSICRCLGADPLGAAPLRKELLVSASDHVRRVILVLVDALSFNRFKRWMVDGTAPVWSRLAEQGRLAPSPRSLLPPLPRPSHPYGRDAVPQSIALWAMSFG
jgi:hypothetical protein